MSSGANNASIERVFSNGGPFSARIHVDPTLDSTVILLSYEDGADPSRSITAGIAPELGSNMFQLRVGDHELIYRETELLKRMDFTGNFVLWPLPNRIRGKSYSFQGQDYTLEEVQRVPGDPELIHGLVFDRPWQYEPPMLGPDAVAVTTYVEVAPGSPYYDAYPFDSRLSLTYTLDKDGVTVAYNVQNKGARALPYGFALHPYFATLSGQDDTWISIPADEVMEADSTLLPTGRLLPLDGIMYAMFDLRQPRPVGHLKLDHVYTGLHAGESATIAYPKQGLRLRLSASDDFTHMVIYTPPGGEPYFCLENQTCATDAINLHQRGLPELAHLLEVPPGGAGGGFIRFAVEFDRKAG